MLPGGVYAPPSFTFAKVNSIYKGGDTNGFKDKESWA